MRVSEVVRSLVAGVAVYVGMAACSAADGPQSAPGGGAGGDGGVVADALLDALTDPVQDARADTDGGGGCACQGVTYAAHTVTCDTAIARNGLPTLNAAVLDVPGLTPALAANIAIVPSFGSFTDVAGNTWRSAFSGAVYSGTRLMVECQAATDTVTFYTPSP